MTKMLEAADNLAEYIQAKGIALDAGIAEELTIMLSKNKEKVDKKSYKGDVWQIACEDESAEVVKLKAKDKLASFTPSAVYSLTLTSSKPCVTVIHYSRC
eukprot:TRINITY_DN30685_c0_g1_i1.p1 TRINITY_DN30685_c0_g1~~TRINITY_DN30685_c0_g1_i1.p1  ORF type:complete len:100 (-),score=7.26 TRINITY_DN30685_c0_g1_i1:14-313(-)